MSQQASTVGSKSFQPAQIFDDDHILNTVHQHLKNDEFRSAIIAAFGLPPSDNYVYHATTAVTLAQVQQAIEAGRLHGLHGWYRHRDQSQDVHGGGGGGGGDVYAYPATADIAAYISLFDPSKSAANSLKGFVANAKKDSLRASIGQHLVSKRLSSIAVPKRKAKAPLSPLHVNPYVDFWAYSCHALEYAGPNAADTANVKTSHHVLPVFMHHFGCVCPSYEALETIAQLSKGKTVVDMGSGNGYWTLMLRRHGCEVVAVDSLQSRWRTTWIDDTVIGDGVRFLRKRQNDNVNGKNNNDDVLLMVYPIVGGEFTEKVFEAYKGDTICVAGTQNGNGYTGFKDMMVDEWMEKNMPTFTKIVQIPLPSFAGKDDALFVFKKG